MDTKSRKKLVAPPRHTAALCLILVAIAAAGFASTLETGSAGATPSSGTPVYGSLLIAEWALFTYARMGLKRGGMSIREITSEQWTSTSLVIDVLIGLALLALWLGLEAGWTLMPWSEAHAGGTLMRRALEIKTAVDIPLWILLSVSAGFVEEVVFRGYLQRQFGALANSAPLGIVAQATLFGVSHGYQGWEPVVRITVFGFLFGLVAFLRKSIRPGMLAHALVDILGGLVH